MVSINGGLGGALANYGSAIDTDITFTDNSAMEGGAIYIDSSGSSSDINNTFTGNTASYGGAIYNTGTLTDNNNTYNNNSATSISGAICNTGTANINNSNFNGNTVTGANGIAGAVGSDGVLTMSSCNFSGNMVSINGGLGGALANYGSATDSNNTFTGNSAMEGGAIYIYNSASSIDTNNTFTGNTASYGGAILNEGSGIITEIQSTFTDNTASYGGAILNDVSGVITEIQSTFIDNTAIYGGAVFNNGGNSTIDFCRIITNTGFDIYSIGGLVNAIDDWWGSNVQSTIAGDIYSIGGTLTYNPWLVLNVTASPAITNASSTVTADLTHDSNGNNSSSSGNIPDGTPVNFTTTFGTIGTTAYTSKGKASTTFNRGTYTTGIAIINATLDNQTIQTNITIDTAPPTVSASLPGGIYNTTQVVNLTATDNFDPHPVVFYSTNNGTTWNNHTNTVTLTLNQGVTSLMFYARDAEGNIGSTQVINYTVDTTPPTVTANLPGGIYNTSQVVNLTATDNFDPSPSIYYTLNGTTPTTSSIKYANPISLGNPGNTTLKFMATDTAGNQAAVQTINYTLNLTLNLTDVELASESVKNYITSTGHVPGYVDIFNENITISSFLNTLALYTVELNNNNTTPVPIISVNPANNPAYNATGTVYESDYIILAGNIASFININGRAPNYANSTIGFIRYESLIYAYSSIMNFYATNNRLPNNVNVIYYAGVDSNGVTINYNSNIVTDINNGKTYTSIQNAVNAASPYDTLQVASGTYTENIIVNNPLTLEAIGNVTIQSASSSDPIITITSGGAGSTIQGFNLNGSTGSYGIYLNSADDNNIIGNNITNNSEGIYLGFSNYNTISGDKLTNSGDTGIFAYYSNNNIITGNNATNNTNYGICLEYCSSSTVSGNILNSEITGIFPYYSNYNIITDNTATNNTKYGISLEYSNNNNVSGNIAINNENTGIPFFESSYNIISENTANSNTKYGIYLESSYNNTISGNTATNNTLDGIMFYSSLNNTISENNFTNNSHAGILFDGSNNNTIQNNNISSNPCGIYLGYYTGINISSDYNTIENNIITYSSTYGIGLDTSNNNVLQNNTLTNNDIGLDVGITGNSDNNTIESNIITNNQCGLYFLNNSADNVTFNIITGNSNYGLYNDGIGTVAAINNWWGQNTTPSSDIDIASGIVISNPWLVLNVTASPIITNNNSTVTVNLTNNSNGNNTSSSGNIPNNIPVNFTTNLGTIGTPVYTSKGIASTTFNRGPSTSGTAMINAAFENYTASTNITIDTVPPNVTASLPSGIYTTVKNVTLTATDNIVPNPVILYSTNNGTTWNNQTNTVTMTLTQGITSLMFYATDTAGNIASTQVLNYTIDTLPLNVTASPPGGVYNTTQIVNLTATDIFGLNTTIYYTLNDTTPTTSSTIYAAPINIIKPGTTTLEFIAIDTLGNQAPIQTQNYTLNLIKDINTGISYSTIQGAVNNASNGDTIEIQSGTFIQNIVINNNLTIVSFTGANPVIDGSVTINSGGNGSTIEGLTLNGNINLYANNCTINGDTIIGNGTSGIIISNSLDNTISNNAITSSGYDGILSNSSFNTVYNNNISGCEYGIYSENSEDNLTSNNLINNYCSILTDNSTDLIQFNRIANNTYGLINEVGTDNATNNWWGSNANPSTTLNDINNISGSVNSNTWLVLNVTSNPPSFYTSSYTITADLTHNNQGNDTSSSGNIPDGIPVNFTTTFGIVGTTVYTNKGQGVFLLNSDVNNISNVTVTLDNQNISTMVTLGVYDETAGTGFSSIQAAINASSPGDIIIIYSATYNENIVIDKNLTILSGTNPLINGSVTINSGGNSSTIQGLTLNGNINLCANNCSIYGNTIYANGTSGIIVSNSFNNDIYNNTITSHGSDGILSNSSSNTLYDNDIYSCEYGVYSLNSNENITSNNMINNYCGIFTDNSTDLIQFDRIANNTYGLINEVGTDNATNNWWGSNAESIKNSK